MTGPHILSGISTGLGVALIGFVIIMPQIPTPSGSTFIEARLCTSGRTIRIEIPGQKQPEKEAPMPCHAVCARDDDGADRNKTRPDPKDDDN